MPIEDVAAREIAAGDVVRLDDPQAQRVERAVHVDGRIVLELRPVGLQIWEIVASACPRTGWYVAWAGPRIEQGGVSGASALADVWAAAADH